MPSLLTAKYIIDRANKQMLNDGNEMVEESEMVNLFNQITKKIIELVPHAYTIMENILLVEGEEQALPTKGVSFVRVMCNMGTDGATEGDAIFMTTEKALDVGIPTWRSDTAVSITHTDAAPVEEDPTRFFIYPPSDGTGYVKVKSVSTPTDITWDSDGDWESAQIPFTDKYSNACVSGLKWKVYSIDTTIAGNFDKSQAMYNEFMQDLGLLRASE